MLGKDSFLHFSSCSRAILQLFALFTLQGPLPTFTQRGDIPLFLTGMMAEFNGLFIVPVYPPFRPTPGPIPQFSGNVWTVQFDPRQPAVQQLSKINYFLAGASGVPTV